MKKVVTFSSRIYPSERSRSSSLEKSRAQQKVRFGWLHRRRSEDVFRQLWQPLYLRPRGVSVARGRRPNTCRNTSPVNSPAAKWPPMTAPPPPRFVAVCYDFAIYIVCVVRWTSVTSVNTAVGGSECLQTLPTSEIYFWAYLSPLFACPFRLVSLARCDLNPRFVCGNFWVQPSSGIPFFRNELWLWSSRLTTKVNLISYVYCNTFIAWVGFLIPLL